MANFHSGIDAVRCHSSSQNGSVVAPHDISVEAGLSMLEAGGNAIDAAVAAALVAGVVEPTETTLGGCGFLVMHDGADSWSAEFGPRAPLAAHAEMFPVQELTDAPSPVGVVGVSATTDGSNVNGPLANGVPRTLLGLLTAQERWGRLSRTAVLKPAIASAYDGFAVDSWFLTHALSDLARLRADPTAAQIFLAPDGLPVGSSQAAELSLASGSRTMVRQQLLGTTLEEAAESPLSALVDGAIAARLVRGASAVGGLLTAEDLAGARPDIVRLRPYRYRDAGIAMATAPHGAATVQQILSLWEILQPGGAAPTQRPDLLRQLALAIRHSFADRYHWLGDPQVVPVPSQELLSADYLNELAKHCANGEDVTGWGEAPWAAFSGRAVHDPWADQGSESGSRPEWRASSATAPTSGTTHISAADSEGRVVAITHTAANSFGSGVVCPYTGLLFDSSMAWFNASPGAANSISPAKRPLANMAPAVVVRGNGDTFAVGASGGRRIISSVAQVIIALVDGGCDAVEALQLPRIDASGPTVQLAPQLAQHIDAVADLGASCVPVSAEPFQMDFARPNVARRAPDGATLSAIPAAAHSA
ncbi:gamma-glutamyltransferase [Streptomyces sp. NBC_00063]|uniref:gamma-glutamyltransferase n=1 Tax=Streptomyces sp. NBC_00063 TaxID=2975638 RepID=UPI003D73C797